MKQVILRPRGERPVRKKSQGRLWKGALVVIGATILTTLAIHASDSLKVSDSSLLAGVGGAAPKLHCPSDMAYVPLSGGGFCIDKYEDSAGDHCMNADPNNQLESEVNFNNPLCTPTSQKGRRPWVNVAEHQALALCAKAGKRLPSNKEWYRAALGTPDVSTSDNSQACALGRVGQSRADDTGAHDICVSSYGAYDMIGNVWEWVDESVTAGTYAGRTLPNEGYVSLADADGVAVETVVSSEHSYANDYFYIDKTSVKGMFRGGFWALSDRAGIFSINAAIPESFVGVAAGFRCAKEAE